MERQYEKLMEEFDNTPDHAKIKRDIFSVSDYY